MVGTRNRDIFVSLTQKSFVCKISVGKKCYLNALTLDYSNVVIVVVALVGTDGRDARVFKEAYTVFNEGLY